MLSLAWYLMGNWRTHELKQCTAYLLLENSQGILLDKESRNQLINKMFVFTINIGSMAKMQKTSFERNEIILPWNISMWSVLKILVNILFRIECLIFLLCESLGMQYFEEKTDNFFSSSDLVYWPIARLFNNPHKGKNQCNVGWQTKHQTFGGEKKRGRSDKLIE